MAERRDCDERDVTPGTKLLYAMRQDHASCNISVGSADLDLDGYGNIMAQSQQIFDCGEPLALDIDEKILLHGTSWKNANSIVCEGFDNRMCQNAFYGAGVYFACAACKLPATSTRRIIGHAWLKKRECEDRYLTRRSKIVF